MFSPSGGSLSNTGQNKTSISDGYKDSNITVDSEVYQIEGVRNISQSAVDTSKQVVAQALMETVDFDEIVNPIKFNIPEGDWMFGDEAKSTAQYGGDQERLNLEFDLYANDPKVMEIINKYYTDVDKEDLELLFAKMDDVGCGYMAAVDTIFAEYADKSPEEFYKKFGFYPTTEKFNKTQNQKLTFYNYDYLFLDFFLHYSKVKGFTTIEEVYGNIDKVIELEDQGKDISIEETGMEGTYENEVAKIFADYLKEKGIDLKTITGSEFIANNQVLDSKTIEKLLGDGNKIVIGGENFNLYESSDTNNNGVLDDVAMEDIEPHTMYLVGTTNDPKKLVISSWGEEYIMDITDISDFVIYNYD